MIVARLAEKDYLPILQMNDGKNVTPENWEQRRLELLEALQTHSYGVTPPAPLKVWGALLEEDPLAYAGKVLEQHISLSFETQHGICTFPIHLYIPNAVQKPPVFLHLAFRPVPDRYIPVEEITDRGFALAVVCFVKIWLVDCLLLGNAAITWQINLVVCLALAVTVVIAKVVGGLLPLVAKAFRLDPAVMASPFITTIVDAVSLLVYFLFANMLLPM